MAWINWGWLGVCVKYFFHYVFFYESISCSEVQNTIIYIPIICTTIHFFLSPWWGCCALCQRHKQAEITHAFFNSVLVSISVFLALSTVFHSINSTDNSPLSHSVLLVLFLPYCFFQQYISL